MFPISMDHQYMKRCLQLASNGKGTCSPNPMVGSVIVHDNCIIGEGWHRKAGEPHAEPNAIRSVKDRTLLKFSTIYVNLEPCSHYGKTPPCVELIIREQIPRVVIGTLDPFPLVAGRGVQKLRDAGIEVIIGVEEEACTKLNAVFFNFHNLKRPKIILKWAQTSDGFIDVLRSPMDGKLPLCISTPFTQLITHKLRSESDAILIGTRTATLDNPNLNVRAWTGRNPIRLVIDRKSELSSDLRLFNGEVETLVYTDDVSRTDRFTTWKHLDFSENVLEQLLTDLYQRNKLVLLVEGGAKLHESFLKQDLWDEIHMEISVSKIGKGVFAPKIANELLKTAKIEKYGEGNDRREIHVIQRL